MTDEVDKPGEGDPDESPVTDAPSSPEGDPERRTEHGERTGETAGQYGESSGEGDTVGPND